MAVRTYEIKGGEIREDEESEERYITRQYSISIYVTFYKAEIPSAYWEDFEEGLPEKSEDYNLD